MGMVLFVLFLGAIVVAAVLAGRAGRGPGGSTGGRRHWYTADGHQGGSAGTGWVGDDSGGRGWGGGDSGGGWGGGGGDSGGGGGGGS